MKLHNTEQAHVCWNSGKALEAGQNIYEQLPVKERPAWAARLLSHCSKLTPKIGAVEKVIEIALRPDLWASARGGFDAVRALTLKYERIFKSAMYGLLLYLAENTAKVTYNATGLPAPYDNDSGWWVVENVRDIVDRIAKPEFEIETWGLVLKTN